MSASASAARVERSSRYETVISMPIFCAVWRAKGDSSKRGSRNPMQKPWIGLGEASTA